MTEVVAELEACQREDTGTAAPPAEAIQPSPSAGESVLPAPSTAKPAGAAPVSPNEPRAGAAVPETAPSRLSDSEIPAGSTDKSSDSLGIATDDTSLSQSRTDSRFARALSAASSKVRDRVSAAGRLLKRLWPR